MKKLVLIAGHAFREAHHSRVGLVLIPYTVLMILCLVFLGAADSGDKVKVMQSVAFIAMSFFGSLLALLMPVLALAEEIETRKVYNILTRPVSRLTFLAGKVVGVNAYIVGFVGVMAVTALALILAGTQAQDRRLLTADRLQSAEDCLYVRDDGSSTPVTRTAAFTRTSEFLSVNWMFSGLDADRATDGFFRCRLDMATRGVGIVMNIDYTKAYLIAVNPDTGERLLVRERPENTSRERSVTVPRDEPVDIYLPAGALSHDGRMTVELLRPGPKYRLFPEADALQIYLPPGTYTGNYLKAVLLLCFRFMFIASVALCGGAFFSRTSGITFGLAIICMAYLIQFIRENVGDTSAVFYRAIFFLFRILSPDFTAFNRAAALIEGRYISWTYIAVTAVTACGIYGAAYLLVAYAGLRDREF